jgi:RHS repeat-associated protein
MKRLLARLLAHVPLASRRFLRIPHSAFRASLALLLICLLAVVIVRLTPASPILDENWQGNWRANWAVVSGYPDSDANGLYQGYQWYATVRYSGSISTDHTAAVSTSCGTGDPENTLDYWITIRSDSTGNLGYQAHLVGSTDQGNWYSLSAVTSSGTYALGSATGLGCDTGITMSAVGNYITAGGLGGYDDHIASGTVAITILDEGRDGRVTRVVIDWGDTTAPTAPTNLTAAAPSATQINLSWTASTDQGSGVSYYKVRRGGNDYATVYAPTTSYSDTSVQPDSTLTYTVVAVDRAANVSALSNSATATTLGPSNLRPEGLGKRPLAAYYGSGPELVNLESGNAVLSFPLIPIQGRTGGISPTLSLAYNSQVWSRDASGVQYTAVDAGYGAGWSLWLGAMYPVYAAGVIDHYRFIDSSGATHRLYPSTGDTYISRDSTYLKWDRVLHRLWFRDGTFWDFDYVSLDPEPDAGTRYPTRLQDTNGNYVTIAYSTGARITQILDSRYGTSPNITHYEFFYTNGRLDTIKEGGYAGNWTTRFQVVYQDIVKAAPFDTPPSPVATPLTPPSLPPNPPAGSIRVVAWVEKVSGSTALRQTIQYNTSGEPIRLTLPYGAYFRYDHASATFSNGAVTRREVASRIYSASANGTPVVEKAESFQHPAGDTAYAGHTQTTINDAAGNRKIWYFTQGEALGWKNGLQWKQEVYQGAGVTLLRTFRTDWTQDQPAVAELRNPRPSAQRTSFNDVTPNLESRREQDVDSNGNVTQVREFGYGDANPYRTLTVTYLSGTAYTQRNILDRTLDSELHEGGPGGTMRLYSMARYDQFALVNMTAGTHDAAYNTSLTARGNATQTRTLAGVYSARTYDVLGKARTVTDEAGLQQTIGYGADTGYTVPQTTNSSTPIGTNMQWNGDLTLGGASTAGGDWVGYSWDNAKRPAAINKSDGSSRTFAYNDLGTPPTAVETVYVSTGGGAPPATLAPGYYTITRTLDGLGRVVLAQDSRTNAYVKYEYDACSCSPTGRQTKVSNPYNPNDPSPNNVPKWTLTAYDALGRVTHVTAPDTSVSTTSFSGNTTTVTDPAGKRKKFTYDAFGNLTQVAEPDAQGDLNVLTNYTYDVAGRLRTVSMQKDPQNSQTRTFTYNIYGQLLSAINPENGAVTYTYDGNLVHSKTDAKGQTALFEYDNYQRLTRIHPPQGANYGYEKRFYYDSYEADPGEHIYGRLAAIEWGLPAYWTYYTDSYVHTFGYTAGGNLTRSKLAQTQTNSQTQTTTTTTLEADFTWSEYGQLASTTYPSGRKVYYRFDSAGRPKGLDLYGRWCPTCQPSAAPYVADTTYNKAGQITAIDNGGTEARTYDDYFRLTRIQAQGLDLSYAYPAAGQDTGRITAETRTVSGTSTTVSYTYDQLNRLSTATSVTGGDTNWGLSFGYDVYGNRTGQTVTAGGQGVPNFQVAFDNNNQMFGFNYDANGNQLTAPGGATLGYDADNRMTSYNSSSVADYYEYHPSGWRVWKAPYNAAGTLYLHGPGGQFLCSYTSTSGGTYTEPIYFAGRLLYTMTAGADASGNWAGVDTIQTDRLGSVRGVNGGSTTRNYYPFGEEIGGPVQGDASQYKFASTYRDSATGLDYAVNRYYASGMGRFLAADLSGGSPMAPVGWNGYLYAAGDPVSGAIGPLFSGGRGPTCGTIGPAPLSQAASPASGGAGAGRAAADQPMPGADSSTWSVPPAGVGGGGAGGGRAPLGGGAGAYAQSFPGSDWPEPECCDPEDPFCDPWGDPIEMGQRKSGQSVRAHSAGCGGGGGGGGGGIRQGPGTTACITATNTMNAICSSYGAALLLCATTLNPVVCFSIPPLEVACAVAIVNQRYQCREWPWS